MTDENRLLLCIIIISKYGYVLVNFALIEKNMAQLTQFGSVALGAGSVGEACLNVQAVDTMQFIHNQTQ